MTDNTQPATTSSNDNPASAASFLQEILGNTSNPIPVEEVTREDSKNYRACITETKAQMKCIIELDIYGWETTISYFSSEAEKTDDTQIVLINTTSKQVYFLKGERLGSLIDHFQSQKAKQGTVHIDAKIYAKDFFLSKTTVFERVASPPKPRLSSLSKSNCKTSMKSNTFLKEIYLLSRVVFGHLVRPAISV